MSKFGRTPPVEILVGLLSPMMKVTARSNVSLTRMLHPQPIADDKTSLPTECWLSTLIDIVSGSSSQIQQLSKRCDVLEFWKFSAGHNVGHSCSNGDPTGVSQWQWELVFLCFNPVDTQLWFLCGVLSSGKGDPCFFLINPVIIGTWVLGTLVLSISRVGNTMLQRLQLILLNVACLQLLQRH